MQDLTARNPNVYYELGIAHILGKEIIPILQQGEEIPFNQKPFRILYYEDNIDGERILKTEIPGWINHMRFNSSPQMMLCNQLIEEFNEWRKSHTRIRFINEEFSSLVLCRIDLSEAFLSESNLSQCILNEANLNNVKLIRADLTEHDLEKANLHEANLSEAVLENTNFSYADLTNSIMLRAKLRGANFNNANVENLTIDFATYNKFDNVFDNAINKEKIIIEK